MTAALAEGGHIAFVLTAAQYAPLIKKIAGDFFSSLRDCSFSRKMHFVGVLRETYSLFTNH